MAASTDRASIEAGIQSIDRHFHRMILQSEAPDADAEDFYIGKFASMDDAELEYQRLLGGLETSTLAGGHPFRSAV
jgi:hypothetical protein